MNITDLSLFLLLLVQLLIIIMGVWLYKRIVASLAQSGTAVQETVAAAVGPILRDELQRLSQDRRAELAQLQQTLFGQMTEVARLQNEQLEAFRTQLQSLQQGLTQSMQQNSQGQTVALQGLADSLNQQMRALTSANDLRLTEIRTGVEAKLSAMQEGNEKKLEQMRVTVDEKLQSTLEQRLGESFRQVAERLDTVHRGLGDMQSLARDVGSLNRVLNNVKTRGIVGEVQLGALLEQVLAAEQYAANVEVVPSSGARVEYAVRLPGNGDQGAGCLWLPIDAKFPREDYERLLDAQERADAAGVEASAKALEQRIKQEARSIRDKYIAAPHTTDFAILFLPFEGLYAEVLRRPGLMQSLQTEHRIVLAGPTTLLAMLNSLQMGFRTLALERRSAEVWEVLGAVKTEFGRFGTILEKTRKKLQEASNTIDSAETRQRALTRKLREVEAMPEADAQALLGEMTFDEGIA
jgi:DNA recombination protein RmuC